MRLRDVSKLSAAELHELAREYRRLMTPAEIRHTAKIARANMLQVARAKEAWRRQCREDGLEHGRGGL